jgi:hypothetical protein
MTRLRGAWGRSLAGAAVFAFSSPPTVAVAPLRLVDGSPVSDTGAMRPIVGSPEAQLRTALAQVGYVLVDSAPISAAIRAADLPADGCHSIACAQTVATATGAARVVTGQISRTSRIVWDITVTLVDPAAGRVLHEETISLRGDPASMLPLGWTSIARRIARHDPALGGTADSILPQ